MTCIECGKEASFRLCSNACALAYAKKRTNVDCAICSFNPKTGGVGRHDTNRICEDCRRAPENTDWIEGRKEKPDLDVYDKDDELRSLREQQDRRLPKITAQRTRIARLIVRGEPMPERTRSGKRRWRTLTTREVADRVGCTQSAVIRLIRHIED